MLEPFQNIGSPLTKRVLAWTEHTFEASTMTTPIVISNHDQLRITVLNELAFAEEDEQKQLIVCPGNTITRDPPPSQRFCLSFHEFASVMSWSLRCCLTCLCLCNCDLSIPGECASEALFKSVGSLHSIRKIVLTRTKFQRIPSSGMSDPWKQLGSAMAKLPNMETLHLSFVSANCPISFLMDPNFRRNGYPLKEFSYNNCFDLRGTHHVIAGMSTRFQQMRRMMLASLRCSNLQTMRIGTFQDGDLAFPIVGRKLGYNLVQPVQKSIFRLTPAVDTPKPFEEVVQVLKASVPLKNLDIKVCTRLDLLPLIHCLRDNKTLQVFIARCDHLRLASGFWNGAMVEQFSFACHCHLLTNHSLVLPIRSSTLLNVHFVIPFECAQSIFATHRH